MTPGELELANKISVEVSSYQYCLETFDKDVQQRHIPRLKDAMVYRQHLSDYELMKMFGIKLFKCVVITLKRS